MQFVHHHLYLILQFVQECAASIRHAKLSSKSVTMYPCAVNLPYFFCHCASLFLRNFTLFRNFSKNVLPTPEERTGSLETVMKFSELNGFERILWCVHFRINRAKKKGFWFYFCIFIIKLLKGLYPVYHTWFRLISPNTVLIRSVFTKSHEKNLIKY